MYKCFVVNLTEGLVSDQTQNQSNEELVQQ